MSESQPSRAEALKQLLRTIEIPSCPSVLVELRGLLSRPDSNLQEIARVTAQDVGLAASLLKVANSPFFGLPQKVDSVAQAVSVLGLAAVSTISAGVLLKNRLGGAARAELDRFWDNCSRIALICARVAREVRGLPTDVAYTYGLFQNAGIAVLTKRFPDYAATLARAAQDPGLAVTTVEDELHSTNHAVIGYLLTRSWGLSEQISQAVLVHHDFKIFRPDAEPRAVASRQLVAVGTLAAHFLGAYLKQPDDSDWIRGGKVVQEFLDLSNTELLDLREYCFEELDLA